MSEHANFSSSFVLSKVLARKNESFGKQRFMSLGNLDILVILAYVIEDIINNYWTRFL